VNPSTAISTEFGSGFVLTDLLHEDFIQRAEDDSGMEAVYQDEDAIIYQINSP
jgi:hypothetical protein